MKKILFIAGSTIAGPTAGTAFGLGLAMGAPSVIAAGALLLGLGGMMMFEAGQSKA
ncbi:hypothetical protein [Roseovarius indicus]|uniref:hypothetical protein n=1 Tax=Roseovarius indicus TaxID=540747 RepID=UPI0032F0886D